MKPIKLNTLSLFLGFLIFGSPLFAQPRPVAEDQVFLKSGKTHTGIIVEQTPGESIRLWRTAESDTLFFEMEAIDRITRIVATPEPETEEPASPAAGPLAPPRVYNVSEWKISFQVLEGGGDYPVGGLGAGIYKYFPRQGLWLGLGANYFGDRSSGGTQSIPVFLHGNYELTNSWKGRFSTGIFAEAGYSFNIEGSYFDEIAQATLRYGNGLHTNIGLRFRLNVLRNVGIWADLGYARHTSNLRFETSGDKLRVKAWNLAVFRASVFF